MSSETHLRGNSNDSETHLRGNSDYSETHLRGSSSEIHLRGNDKMRDQQLVRSQVVKPIHQDEKCNFLC